MTSPINASIVTTTTPIITMIIAGLLPERACHRKESDRDLWSGLPEALLLILSSQSAAAGGGKSSNIWGDLLCLLAQFSFSFYFVLFKGLDRQILSYYADEVDVYLRFHLYDTVHLQSYFSDRLCKPAQRSYTWVSLTLLLVEPSCPICLSLSDRLCCVRQLPVCIITYSR